MDADTIVLVLTCMAAVTALTRLATGRAVRLWTVATVVLVGLALAVAWFYAHPDGSPDSLVTVVAGLVAVAGGGLVTTQVFGLVDTGLAARRRAGEVLRGGAWIGALERLGVYVALVAGWPAGPGDRARGQGPGPLSRAAQPGDTGAAERSSSAPSPACLGRGLCRPGRAHVVAARPGTTTGCSCRSFAWSPWRASSLRRSLRPRSRDFVASARPRSMPGCVVFAVRNAVFALDVHT